MFYLYDDNTFHVFPVLFSLVLIPLVAPEVAAHAELPSDGNIKLEYAPATAPALTLTNSIKVMTKTKILTWLCCPPLTSLTCLPGLELPIKYKQDKVY